MVTRLDRLFLLLESGSTPVIRKSAAEQLGEVQKLHPHEFHNLLTKVHTYLVNNQWETRIAAGQAVEAIARNVPQWEPKDAVKKEEGSVAEATNHSRLVFSQFDIGRVLTYGASLLGSEGVEYDVEDEVLGLDQKERLAQQKRLLNKRLGLDVAGGLGMSSDDLYGEDDLVMRPDTPHCLGSSTQPKQSSVVELVKQQLQAGGATGLSSRERNRAKRKAKLIAKQVSKEAEKTNGEGSDSEPSSKKRKTTTVVVEQPSCEDKVVVDNVADNTMNLEEMDEWPFESFCELLMHDLFHTSWERRHGAATGLREVLKLHGCGAGKTTDTPSDQLELENQCWLEDLVLRLVCVLALDRFGDFVADEVVAPVRETCAQTLGVSLQHMAAHCVEGTVHVLLQLLGQGQWEVRHGGLLGLKYVLAIRQDMSVVLLPKLLPALFMGLQDRDDDVRAVAAAALLPVADQFVSTLPHQIPAVVQCLWFTLLDLDDLTASTNSIMMLLSTLLAHPSVDVETTSSESLSELVPRLWPFLRHNIPSVRMATLKTLHTLLTKVTNQGNPVAAPWLLPILQDAMRHVYQRTLVEHKEDILEMVHKVWCALLAGSSLDHLVAASLPWVGVWLCLMMQPPNLPFDQSLLIEARHQPKENTPSRLRHSTDQHSQLQNKEQRDFIGGAISVNESQLDRDLHVTRARIMAARCLGLLCSYQIQPQSNLPEGMEPPGEALTRLLLFHLNTKSALQRFCVSQVAKHWAVESKKDCRCPEPITSRLSECLSEAIYYDEIVMGFSRMQTECQDFISSLKQQGVELDSSIASSSVLTLEQAQALVTTVFDAVQNSLKSKHEQSFEDRRKHLTATVSSTCLEQQTLACRVQSSLAGAIIVLESLPEKLNPVIRPLMEALRKEENMQLQMEAAGSLSRLLLQCTKRTPCPNPKVVKNLCSMLCCNPSHTPSIEVTANSSTNTESGTKDIICDKYSGILTLNTQIKESEQSRRKLSLIRRNIQGSVDITSDMMTKEDIEGKRLLVLQQRGAVSALTILACDAGSDLPTLIPHLWENLWTKLGSLDLEHFDVDILKQRDEEAQELVNSLQVLEVVGPVLDTSLHSQLVRILPHLCKSLEYPHTAVRHMAARSLGRLGRLITMETMNSALSCVLPLLGADVVAKRQGSIEALANLIDQLGIELVPYIVLLVIPVLGCISDQDEAVRQMATHCFATLIRLMPLEVGIPDPPEMSQEMAERREQERHFLEQLLDVNKLDSHPVPVPIEAELRKYQQDGVNWLWFLNKYKLHGILCDDMGLGKTLQSICILAADNFLREEQYEKSKDMNCTPLPSIVVCPPTLTGHWVYEVEKFVSREYLNPLHYTGPPAERARLQKRVKYHNVIIASYDVVRNDIDFFGKLRWNYCILDEGHIIKNSKTKMARAVKQLQCCHRLILSGTPIQNNVLELWSLFDFLMPGYLGTERQFQQRYGKPILQSRDAKSSSREQEAGALAMEALHRQVLPFLLRRMKEDVLKDLPPKIIQDYYCDLSSLQVRLYEDFARSRAKKSVDDAVSGPVEDKKQNNHGHIFQALQYLRKVCNHPALVLTGQHPEYETIKAELKQRGTSLHDLQHAPKLTALKQLLLDCGLGGGGGGTEGAEEPVVNQHRILLFCQLKSMLDIVEHDLLKNQLPSVTYLRLDGSVPAGSRHGLVNRFNNDPSIDLLLLTTHVGGLGLNLTGADTVIFVEHDWNPMKDLQAMDRAHRIGQKKVVNVYRLITRGTLEEKIMGLQKFKLNIANTVISQDNSSLSSMGTDQLLDLFSLDDAKPDQSRSSADISDGKTTMKNVLERMDDLWDEKQYEHEYDLTNFMKSLSK